jgi:hypothetical protein
MNKKNQKEQKKSVKKTNIAAEIATSTGDKGNQVTDNNIKNGIQKRVQSNTESKASGGRAQRNLANKALDNGIKQTKIDHYMTQDRIVKGFEVTGSKEEDQVRNIAVKRNNNKMTTDQKDGGIKEHRRDSLQSGNIVGKQENVKGNKQQKQPSSGCSQSKGKNQKFNTPHSKNEATGNHRGKTISEMKC